MGNTIVFRVIEWVLWQCPKGVLRKNEINENWDLGNRNVGPLGRNHHCTGEK